MGAFGDEINDVGRKPVPPRCLRVQKRERERERERFLGCEDNPTTNSRDVPSSSAGKLKFDVGSFDNYRLRNGRTVSISRRFEFSRR